MHTTDETAERFSLTPEQVREVGTLLGFPDDEGVPDDAWDMLEIVSRMIRAGLPWESIIEGARVYADNVGRMAEMGIQMTHRYVCEPLERAGHPPAEVVEAFARAGAVAGPSSAELVSALYQRYMTQAAQAHLDEHSDAGSLGSMRRTILFCDLALFTSLADTFGDEEAVRVIDRFDHSVREYSFEHGGKLVKQIGDEFMLVFKDPAQSVQFAVALHETMARTERFVALRTGIHFGPVLYRMADYYGAAVNVAARIASMAMPNAILVTEPVAKAAADVGIGAEEVGVRSLRGMEEPLALYRIKER